MRRARAHTTENDNSVDDDGGGEGDEILLPNWQKSYRRKLHEWQLVMNEIREGENACGTRVENLLEEFRIFNASLLEIRRNLSYYYFVYGAIECIIRNELLYFRPDAEFIFSKRHLLVRTCSLT